MAKLSQLFAQFAQSPQLKGVLKNDISVTVDRGVRARTVVVPKGTISDLLIATQGLYHFEVGDVAFTVTAREMTFI